MAYKSKYSGEEVEGLLDKVNDGGTGEGITEIETNADSPLNLEVTIAGTLATITGSIDLAASGTSNVSYGVAMCDGYTFSSKWTGEKSFSAQFFDNNWGNNAIDSGVEGDDSPQLFYRVYQSNNTNSRGLMVGLPYPAPGNIPIADSLDENGYVLCVTSSGYLRKVPASLFAQEE